MDGGFAQVGAHSSTKHALPNEVTVFKRKVSVICLPRDNTQAELAQNCERDGRLGRGTALISTSRSHLCCGYAHPTYLDLLTHTKPTD